MNFRKSAKIQYKTIFIKIKKYFKFGEEYRKMKKNDCVFCKIISGEYSSKTIYEDDKFKVFFDLGPATRGHALIVPKEHCENVFELDDDLASEVFVLAKRLATVMKSAFKADGFNIVQNNGKLAGQSVFHFHMHLIPRYKGDDAIKFWEDGETSEEELTKLQELVREELNK